jgi:uncharacterized lipoprotein
MRSFYWITALVSATLLAACAVGPDYRRPEVALTDSYVNSSVIAAAR